MTPHLASYDNETQGHFGCSEQGSTEWVALFVVGSRIRRPHVIRVIRLEARKDAVRNFEKLARLPILLVLTC